MKKLILGLLIFGLTIQGYSQVDDESKPIELSEVNITAANYKYLNSVGDTETAIAVTQLEKTVASFDLKNSKYFEEESDEYLVYFKVPVGKILAAYDNEGEIIRTQEKFVDIQLPLKVSNTIVDNYPGWKITGDIYLVKYMRSREDTFKMYKLFIEKDGKTKKIKTDEHGKIMK